MLKDYPSLHPLAIHFPIVLILLAFAFQLVVVVKPTWVQIRWATLFIMAGGFLSAWAASTLFHAMIAPNAPKSSWIAFNAHEQYAQYTLWASGVVLLLKGLGDFYKINRRSYDIVVLIAAIISGIFLSIAGHHGAQLTHIEGVGPMGRYLGTEEDEKNMEKGGMNMGNMKMDSAMKMNDSMPGMKHMKDMDTMKEMKGMKGMNMMDDKKMKDMPGMSKMNGMDNMKKMSRMNKMNSKNSTKEMKGMNMNGMDMQNMKDVKMNSADTIKPMPGMQMSGMDNMKKMPGMNGMDTMKSMQGMDNTKMTDMKGMQDMKGMDNMQGMKGMKRSKLIDASKPYDNNPALQKPASARKNQ